MTTEERRSLLFWVLVIPLLILTSISMIVTIPFWIFGNECYELTIPNRWIGDFVEYLTEERRSFLDEI